MESITEFDEPYIEDQVKKIKELGLKFGIHGETAAGGMHTTPLDSALNDDYLRAHERLIQQVRGAGKIEAVYVVIHASESVPFILLGRELQATRLVDIWGRRLDKFLDENRDVLDWAIDFDPIMEGRHVNQEIRITTNEELEKFRKAHKKDPTEDESKELLKIIKEKALKSFVFSNDLEYGAERIAYGVIGKWMELRRDPLWSSIVGNKKLDEKFFEEEFTKWVPAVAAKYIWGHFHPKETSRYPDPKPILEKNRVIWAFEPEMTHRGGYEKHMRIMRIPHLYQLVNSIGSNWTTVAIDFEHLLSGGFDPKKEIADLPYGAGEKIKIVHVGWPTPHAPAHIPIYLGSDAQQYLYERLFELRQKGFKTGWIIFERGGGEDPVKESVISLRKIVEFLEKDVLPKELPLDFYGMKPQGPELSRQEVTIRDHAMDPLRGMLLIPEEEYTFLSSEALKKGKRPEEWKKEEFR